MSTEEIVQILKTDGMYVLPEKIDRSKIDEFNNYLSTKEIWDKHVKYHAHGRPGTSQSSSMSWSMEDVILAPHLFDISLTMTQYAELYLQQQPHLYSINAFTTNPISGPTQSDIQEYHRDIDDSKFLALFIFCTDVTPDGAHQFIKGSHLDANGRGVDGREMISIHGEAGTMFLGVTYGLHRGLRPVNTPRTLFWARWGVSNPPWSYGWDHLQPVNAELLGDRYPSDEKMRNIIQLVVK
jgi:hypothetical protein